MGCIPSKEDRTTTVTEPLIKTDEIDVYDNRTSYMSEENEASYNQGDGLQLDYDPKATEQALCREIVDKLDMHLIDVVSIAYSTQGQNTPTAYCAEYFSCVKKASISDNILRINTLPNVPEVEDIQNILIQPSLVNSNTYQEIKSLSFKMNEILAK
ncbi:hypothetical protein WA158_000392 [Blastocystis sp. Blastoise]